MGVLASPSSPGLALPASLTLDDARRVMARIGDEMRRLDERSSPACVIDASGLEHFDSSALAILIECHRIATRRPGGQLEITGAPRSLKELARLYGLTELVGLS
jgi:phospholipid transport system transporter-binding protein